jgi:DNA invertase Pin-like site-specific DNA recombinase
MLKAKAPPTRAAVYCRVSTEEAAEGQSLYYQSHSCRAYAEGLGIQDIEVYEDPGYSGKNSEKRPAFQRMLADAKAGRFQVLLVYRWDRFARNVLDSRLAKAQLRAAGVQIVSVTEPAEDSPAGNMTGGIFEVFAEYFSAELAAKVGKSLRTKAERGLPIGPLPFGYQRSSDPRSEPPIVVPDESEAVRHAYEWFSTGTVTYKDLAAWLNEKGFRTRHCPTRKAADGSRPWTGDSVRALIQNALYKGVVTHKGEELPGRHEAIVSPDLWERANRASNRLRGRSTTWAPVRFYSLAGIIKCAGCGSNLQGNHSKSGEQYRYYRETAARRGVACEKPQIAVRADRAEAEVDRIVAGLRVSPEVQERVLELLSGESDPEEAKREERQLTERLRRLARLYADMQIGEDEYTREKSVAEAKLARYTVPPKKADEAVRQFDVLQLAWSRATPEEKRALGLALFEAIYFDLETMEITSVVPQPAFRPWIVSEAAG